VSPTDRQNRTPAADGGVRPPSDAGEPSPSPLPDEARCANLALWDEWARIHEGTEFYDVAGFKAGRSTLWPLETEELGPYVGDGTSLLHLQCHFGLDTLSWARRGAEVVGVDFSGEAIALARRLAAEVGLSDRASFVQSDVYDAGRHLDGRRFDVVFVSWGAIEWLPDLERWARLCAAHLKAGGRFYMAELHPLAYCLDETADPSKARIGYRYFPAPERPVVEPVEGSYADPSADTSGHVSYSWSHSFSEIVGALLGAGLRLEYLHEGPFSVSPFFESMEKDESRWWWLPDGHGGRRTDLPFSYSVMATRPSASAAANHHPVDKEE
jgi:SAM-dependent methyltransferase